MVALLARDLLRSLVENDATDFGCVRRAEAVEQILLAGVNTLSITNNRESHFRRVREDVGDLEHFVDVLLHSIAPVHDLRNEPGMAVITPCFYSTQSQIAFPCTRSE